MGILGGYDASADYWKLMRNGELKYDGKATLTDEDGNVLMTYQQMGVSSDNIIEGSLAFLLTGKNDAAGAALARQYMLEAKMEHTNNEKPVDEWRWKDGDNGAITEANKKKGINLFNKLDTIGSTMVAPLFAGLFDYQTDVQASYLLRGLDPTKDLDDQDGIYDAMKALYGTGPVKPILGGVVQLSLGANRALGERFDNLLDAKVGFYFSRTAFLRDGAVSAGRDVRLSTDFGSKHPGTYPSTNDIHVGGGFCFQKSRCDLWTICPVAIQW